MLAILSAIKNQLLEILSEEGGVAAPLMPQSKQLFITGGLG